MGLGLKRGTVKLEKHDCRWEICAAKTIEELWRIFGPSAKDIRHIGSTAIGSIQAKPVIDIVIGVESFDFLDKLLLSLENMGVCKSAGQPFENIVLFSVDDKNGLRTHNIQVVIFSGIEWLNHIAFRNYLNGNTEKAREYENLKSCLTKTHSNDLAAYSDGKKAFIEKCLSEIQNNC